MNEPRRWLEENHGDADAVSRLLQSQRCFRALDPAAASRVKHAVLHAAAPLPAHPFNQSGAFGRLRSALSQLGQHQFSATAVAATTLGAAALGGLLAVLGNVHLEAAHLETAHLETAHLETATFSKRADLVETAARDAASAALLAGTRAGSLAEAVRTARDPWAAALWGRREGLEAERCWSSGQSGRSFSFVNVNATALLSPSGYLADLCLSQDYSLLQDVRWNLSFSGSASEAATSAQLMAVTGADASAAGFRRDGSATTTSEARRTTASRRARASDAASGVTTASAVTTASGRRAVGRSSGDPRGLRDETLLLEAARSDLARNPKSALQTALEHQQQFPQGQLTSQRLLIQIEAMLRLGQDASAINLSRSIHNPLFSSRAKDLLTRYGAADSVKE